MKNWIFLVATFGFFSYCSAQTKIKNTTDDVKIKKDTLFLQYDDKLGSKQSIYQLKKSNIDQYKSITNFELNEFEKEVLQSQNEAIKKNKKSFPNITETQWIKVYKYKGDFYVYQPCDFINERKMSIDNSIITNWNGENPSFEMILNQKKISKNQFSYQVNSKGNLYLKIIDSTLQLAIVKSNFYGYKPEYSFMIPAKNAHLLPIIINNCKEHKQNEFTFDALTDKDFEDLLRK